MKSAIDTIIAAKFMATGAQVEQLAATVVEGIKSDGTYLKVLVAHVKELLPAPKRKGHMPPQEPVLDKVHEELYPHVLKGVGPEDMEQRERFRLATFARTAASTLRYFIRYGGDIRTLDPGTVTKGLLRQAVSPELEGTPAQRNWTRSRESLLKSILKLGKEDSEAAHTEVQALIVELETILEQLGEEEAEAEPEQAAAPPPRPARGKVVRAVRHPAVQ